MKSHILSQLVVLLIAVSAVQADLQSASSLETQETSEEPTSEMNSLSLADNDDQGDCQSQGNASVYCTYSYLLLRTRLSYTSLGT